MMAQRTGTKRKQLSRGQRTHVRRLKQEARRGGTTYRSPFNTPRSSALPRKDEQTS